MLQSVIVQYYTLQYNILNMHGEHVEWSRKVYCSTLAIFHVSVGTST